MPRPNTVTDEDIARWSEIINNEEELFKLSSSEIMKELMFAGLWLEEELQARDCPEKLLGRIQIAAGKYAFGRDVWEACKEMLEMFINNELKFEIESAELN